MLNRMEMIRIFCSAADCSNFREAATRLRISPQAVTRAIKALEEELGEILFHRNTRQVHITAFGEAYALRRLLQKRFGLLSEDVLARLQAASIDELELWLDRALDADSLAGVFAQ